MGIDATVFQRIPSGVLTGRERERIPEQMHAVFPDHLEYTRAQRRYMKAHLSFPNDLAGSIHPYGPGHREWLKPDRWLSGVTIHDDDLVFWPRLRFGRFYDFHYASGSLPRILMATWWMEERVPEGDVLYAGDDKGYRLSDRIKGALMHHYCRYGHRWYTSRVYLQLTGNYKGPPSQEDEEAIAAMWDAFREDFGGDQFNVSELDSSWREVKWRALAYHLTRIEGWDVSEEEEWPLPVPELSPADLGPLLDSFHHSHRLYGARLALEVDGCSESRAVAALEPLLVSEQEELRLKALSVTRRIDCISSEMRKEVLADLLASESVHVRRQALRLSGRERAT